MNNSKFSIIVAINNINGIGFQNKIPWREPSDLKFFREVTSGNVVIMGRKTFESMNSKPLKNRINIVISQTMNHQENVLIAESLDHALNLCNELNVGKIFVIGGEQIYNEAIKLKECKEILPLGAVSLGLVKRAWSPKEILAKKAWSPSEILAEKIYISKIPNSIECDTFFPYDYVRQYYTLDKKIDLDNRIQVEIYTRSDP